jgi:hypothetical protein
MPIKIERDFIKFFYCQVHIAFDSNERRTRECYDAGVPRRLHDKAYPGHKQLIDLCDDQ